MWVKFAIHFWYVACLYLAAVANIYVHIISGPRKDLEKAKAFIRTLFINVAPIHRAGSIFTHFTCATDTDNIKKIFSDVRSHILQGHISEVIGV